MKVTVNLKSTNKEKVFTHIREIQSNVFSPDHKEILFVGYDHEVKLREVSKNIISMKTEFDEQD